MFFRQSQKAEYCCCSDVPIGLVATDGICQSRRAFSAIPEGRVVVLVLVLWPHMEYASLGVLFRHFRRRSNVGAQTFPGLASFVVRTRFGVWRCASEYRCIDGGLIFLLEAMAARLVVSCVPLSMRVLILMLPAYQKETDAKRIHNRWWSVFSYMYICMYVYVYLRVGASRSSSSSSSVPMPLAAGGRSPVATRALQYRLYLP